MPTAMEAQCSAILYAAASAAVGIRVRTDDPVKARTALYKFRNLVNDPELASLSVRVSPLNPEKEIWILSNRNATSVNLDLL